MHSSVRISLNRSTDKEYLFKSLDKMNFESLRKKSLYEKRKDFYDKLADFIYKKSFIEKIEPEDL